MDAVIIPILQDGKPAKEGDELLVSNGDLVKPAESIEPAPKPVEPAPPPKTVHCHQPS